MEKLKLLKNLRHRLSLLLCLMAFLAVGQGAWAEKTLHLLVGTSDDYTSWTDVSTATGTTDFTFNMGSRASGTNYFFALSTSSSYSDIYPNTSTSEGDLIDGEGGSLLSQRQGRNRGSYYFYLVAFQKAGTITITYNDNTKKYTLTSGGSSTDTWTLRGQFNSWSSSANVFTGSGNSLSCSVSLTKQDYKQGVQGDGFKIVKNDGSNTTWYGAKTTITRGNNSATFQTGSGDEWNCGLSADLAGNYTFTITNLTGNPELTVTYPQSTYAIARWGGVPTIDGSKNINASAYVATHGCDGSSVYTVTQLKVRYWKEGDEANSEVKETTTGTYSPGTAYQIVIPYTSNVLMNCTTVSKIIMEVACRNGLGWSAYSDRMAVIYQANHVFVTSDLEKDFTACDGNHQFTLSDMVKPVPDSWTVTSGGAEAKSEFTLTDGEMIWKPGDKTTGTYNYTFTFSKDGYEPVNPTLTINYEKTAPTGNVSITTPSASEVNATKLQEVALAATKGTGVVKIKWTATPDTYITTTNSDGTNATFQGKAIKTYTVTAVGLSASCGETAASNSVTINVSKDTEDCNE